MNENVVRDIGKLGTALHRLEEALKEPESSTHAWEETVRAFEYAMDLFWRVAKEMLAARGIETHMPREAVHYARERGWLEDENLWIEMLKDEYQVSGGTVDPATLRRLYPRIRGYYPEMCRVEALLAARAQEEQGS